MKKTPEYAYFLIGFAVLTVILVIAGMVSSKGKTNNNSDRGISIHDYMKEKSDIIEPGPMLLEPREEVEQTVVSYRSRAKDIIRIDRPLPLLPKENTPVDPGILHEKGVLKNLYKESNKYYIDNDDQQKPSYHKGIKD